MTKYVYLFKEGNANMRELLGGKGANLAEMTNLGMPVPQGLSLIHISRFAHPESHRRHPRPPVPDVPDPAR